MELMVSTEQQLMEKDSEPTELMEQMELTDHLSMEKDSV